MGVKKITVFGKTYVSAPELRSRKCFGCAFDGRIEQCTQAYAQVSCDVYPLIWKGEDAIQPETTVTEQTFTCEEIAEIMDRLGYAEYNINGMRTEMKKYSNPEYVKYLELKKKFEQI